MNSITKSIIMIILGFIFGVASCFAQAEAEEQQEQLEMTYIGYVVSKIASAFDIQAEAEEQQETTYEYSLIEYEEYQFEINNAPDREGAAPSR